jgi:hypothetical protein
MRIALCCRFSLIVIGTTSPAVAKEAAIVAVSPGGTEAAMEVALTAVRRAIDGRSDVAVLNAELMARRIRRRVRKPAALDPAIEGNLEREAREMLEAVAFGRDDETTARSRAIVRRETPRLAATNRSDRAARALGDICLFSVRASLHLGDTANAQHRARQCLGLVPDLSASPETHPEDVRALLPAARAARLGRLEVIAVPARPSCELRIQGRPAGKLPARLELVPGAYAVQVDCGAIGSIKEVLIEAGGTERVLAFPRLEQALLPDSPTVLHLQRGEAAIGRQELSQLAEWLGISELWTLRRTGQQLHIVRWEHSGASLVTRGETLEPLAPYETFEPRIEAAAARIACMPNGCGTAAREPEGSGRTAWTLAGGVGVTAMFGSWLAWARYAELDSDLDDPSTAAYEDKLDERDTWGGVALVSTVAGSTLFAGAALFLPDAEPAPWLAWTSGAVGVAALATGTALWLRNGRLEAVDCPDPQPCLRRRSTIPLAPILVTQGASLLAFPVRSLTKGRAGPDARNVTVSVAPGELRVGWTQNLPSF